ncbi:Retrovirus-related Pol polyprotein from transposon TNT 1-94 [Cucumis melo var. makuwa]|uniref:Retrovirus-related Pol polyprotein from transposon TNT 1-94 n=1 Tax=Cucumis melo var. makuwa TaxID=1194695 RepID=A0A5A7SG80_CUCMM|nr:Retrovirus-related Pol polyprotein from transposon TNT 1-94 [Cucumis melo var. makuwa]
MEFRHRDYTAEAKLFLLGRDRAEIHPLSVHSSQQVNIADDQILQYDDPLRADDNATVSGFYLEDTENSPTTGVSSEYDFLPAEKEWSSFTRFMTQRFPVPKLVSVTSVSNAIIKVGKTHEKSSTGMHSEELEDPQSITENEVKVITRQDYINRLREFKDDLIRAWDASDRVTSLKISMKVTKLLKDTCVLQFYPTLFVLVTDILDMLGNFVWDRIKRKAEFTEDGARICSLPENFKIKDICQNAKETCHNWFCKIGAIQELLPRIYLELALLPCWRFLSDQPVVVTQRLVVMARGLADPLASAYCRLYLTHCAHKLPSCDVGVLISCVNDMNVQLKHFITAKETDSSTDNKVLLVSVMEPTIEYIVKCMFKYVSQRELDRTLLALGLGRNMEISQCVSVVLHHILKELAVEVVSSNAMEFLQLINQSNDSSFRQFMNYRLLGLRLCEKRPPVYIVDTLVNNVLKGDWLITLRFTERSNNETLENFLGITRTKTVAAAAAVDTTMEKLLHRIQTPPIYPMGQPPPPSAQLFGEEPIHALPLSGAWAHAPPPVNLTAHPIRFYASSPVQPSHSSNHLPPHAPPIAAGQQPSKLSNLYSNANLYNSANLSVDPLQQPSCYRNEVDQHHNRLWIEVGEPSAPSSYGQPYVHGLGINHTYRRAVFEHCKKQRHAKDRCWKLHGRPLRGNKRSSKEQQNLGRTDVRETASTSQPIGPTASQSSPTLSVIAQSDHLTGFSEHFVTYTPCAGNEKIRIVDGSLAPISGKDKYRITRELHCKATFLLEPVCFQDLNSGRTIGTARHSRGLYILNDDTFGSSISTTSLLSSYFSTSEHDFMLWHFRAKHRVSFPSQPYKPTQPFTLIHSDVWGPSKVTTSSGKRWFVTFTDDHTRLTWVYLITDKSEGIVHQNSCAYTPQQNGVAERKNCHLLEVACSLMLSTSLPSYLWGDAILTAAHLINRMPSRILHLQTPLECLKESYPSTRLVLEVSLRVFGCTAYVRSFGPNQTKFTPGAQACVFVGYPPHQRGYKCFHPPSRKYFVTMDVTFCEDRPYFLVSHLHGESVSEESNSTFEFIEPTPSTVSDIDPHPIILPTNQVPWKTYYRRNLRKEVGSPTNQPSAPVQDFEPPRDQGMENPTEPCTNNTMSENDKSDAAVLENMEEKNHGDKTEVRIETSNDEAEQGHTRKHDEYDPSLDLPIALRKGTRSCTKHSISNYVSYENLSPQFRAFTAGLDSTTIPRIIYIALECPEWKNAVMEEMKALEKNNIGEICALPKGHKPVGCKWVFTLKYKADGTLDRHKTRLVAKGFTQTYGVDYSETFSPVAKLNIVRVLLSVAVNKDWPLYQLDIKNAFLNGDLVEEVYMSPPPGFEAQFGQQVCKLQKSLYGLKQSPRAWFDRFTTFVKSQGYSQGHSDHTLFTKVSETGKIAVLIVYVDDIVLSGDDQAEISQLKQRIGNEFEIEDLGNLKYFLGMEVARSKEGISVSQRKYTLDLLTETGMLGCCLADTPIEFNCKLGNSDDQVPVDKEQYQRLVGKLIYLSHTHPDISFAVSAVSQFMQAPYEEHMEAVKRILRYLKTTPGKGLMFRKTDKKTIEAYTDSDWAGSIVDRKSTSGYCTFVWGNLVTWRSKKQNVVSRSSAEAEYKAMSLGICEEIWLQKVLSDLHQECETPLKLFCDNKAAISIANTQFSMIELNMLRLIGISSKKDLTVGAYAFRTSLRANRLLMSLPRGFSDQTSTFVLASWASLIFTFQLEGEC